MSEQCTHIDQLPEGITPKTPEGCEECLAVRDPWNHLRLCLTCGHVGCCDNSKNKHATKHYEATKHPIIKAFKPDEPWVWCYTDELQMFEEEIQKG